MLSAVPFAKRDEKQETKSSSPLSAVCTTLRSVQGADPGLLVGDCNFKGGALKLLCPYMYYRKDRNSRIDPSLEGAVKHEICQAVADSKFLRAIVYYIANFL